MIGTTLYLTSGELFLPPEYYYRFSMNFSQKQSNDLNNAKENKNCAIEKGIK